MSGNPTVLARWVGTVVQALNRSGHDGAAIARRAGIDPAVFDIEGARLPLRLSTRLWELAVEATGDPGFGLEVARLVRPSTFAGLSMGVVSSGSFREALERSSRYGEVVLSTPEARGRVTEDDGRLVWKNRVGSDVGGTPVPADEAMEAILGCIVLSGRFLLGPSFAPVEVCLRRPEPEWSRRFRSFFRCPVRFGADDYRLEFDVADIDRPLRTGSRQLAAAADHMAAQLIEDLESSGTLAARVRSLVAHGSGPDGPPSTAELAADLAMSPRTLQRRLRDEGVTVRQVVDEVQLDLAVGLLTGEGLTVELAAARLGFHDASSFRRAFRRWTGTTPQEHLAGR